MNAFSSSVEHGREIVGTIPSSHENLTRFSSPYDVGFIRISAALSRWIDEIKNKRPALTSQNDEIIHVRISICKLASTE